MSTRRQFIFECSTALAALAWLPVSASNFTELTRGDERFQSLEQMSYALLAGQINSHFLVRLSPRRVVELKLLKAPLMRPTPVKLGRPLPGDAGYEKFSLIFSGPKDVLLPSAIHQFEHPQLGQFAMFIGQIGLPHADSVRYQAAFNRPPPPPLTKPT